MEPPPGPPDLQLCPGPLTHLGRLENSEGTLERRGDGPTPPGRWDRVLQEQAAFRQDWMRRSLQLPSEQTVRILHAKVAQKSYGNEKRFFCPPPCVYLAGPGWRLKAEQGQAPEAGELGPTVCGYMGLDGTAETQKLNFEEQPDSREFGCAKALFISDADKRKHFRLVLRLVLRGGRELGTFHSHLIKVISKPSQKKQSLKNTDLCISSGSKVSLFNRLRSQTVSTRYLSVEGGAFIASARQWAAFTLHLADERVPPGDFPLREGYIRYGSLVQLVCTVTGVTLPPMIIRKVAKQCALLDVDEPISQLHKCALQFPSGGGEGGLYLCLATEKVVQFQASPCPKEANRALLNDSSCWTIIGTESVEFSFRASLSCAREPVTPVPLISTLELSGGGDVATLELQGENFHGGLKVWFGDVEAETLYRSPRSLVCVVPDVAAFGSDWRWLRVPITVPLRLMRADGLLYSSAFSFTYTPEQNGLAGLPGLPERPQDSDTFLDSIHHEFTRTNFHLFIQN
ncbi:recombining binding protein suppressor of hairless-like protein [Tachyglossus aculeatus]|uniref:recombining binding protein suppressor of hairless-like protein n=1 Tax=Tachyglossus aculeatus TaxID=9261 RepID=UPI0018F78868|nr:recombining binding protein suppressor of hairless-like protein [Tachyglossus aculeatus]